jgi:hypothetical protein
MSFAVVSSLSPHTRSTALEESIMTATYTFDVFSSLDGYGSHSGNWGGYWGKQGPELLDRRLALYDAEQRMVFGANTYRAHARMLASSTEESEVLDPWVTRMRSLPATVVSTTLEEPLDWPDARRPHPRAHLPTHPACLSPSMHPCNGPPSTDWRTIKNMRAAIEREQDE